MKKYLIADRNQAEKMALNRAENPEAVKKAYKAVQRLTPEDQLKRLLNQLDGEALYNLEECGKWDDITNSIIHAFFQAAQRIVSMYGAKNHQLVFAVNSLDSHLWDYHDGEYEEIF